MNENNKEFFEKLSAPFTKKDGTPDVKYRILKGSTVVPYISAIQVINRLNSVCGYGRWNDITNEVAGGDKAMLCTLTIRLPDDTEVSHDGVGAPSNVHSFKGMHSDALKRAALKFGIGMHEKQLPNLTLNQIQGKPATQDGRVLVGDAISAYINDGNPSRIFLTSLYKSLLPEKQKALGDKFKELWEMIIS
jgi:hypothetical protein